MWIEVEADGPYIVHGNVPLVCKTQVVSEYGEPLTWRKDGDIRDQRRLSTLPLRALGRKTIL